MDEGYKKEEGQYWEYSHFLVLVRKLIGIITVDFNNLFYKSSNQSNIYSSCLKMDINQLY